MKLKISIMVLIMVFSCIIINPTVFAGDSNVTYHDNAERFVFTPSDDLFVNFKNVMPGDVLSQDITIKNSASNNKKVKIYLQAKPIKDEYIDFLSQLDLEVTQGNIIQTHNLENKICLGTFYSGDKTKLVVDLKVPITLGNEYQNDIGKIEWVFSVEEIPITSTSTTSSNAPKTGDLSNILLFSIIGIIAAGLLISIAVLKRRLSH